jgi:hypothetical protein
VRIATEGPPGWSAFMPAANLNLPVSTGFHTNVRNYSKHYGTGFLKNPIAAYLRKFHNLALATLVPAESIRHELECQGFRNLHIVSRSVDTGLFSPAQQSSDLRRSWGVCECESGLAAMYVGRTAPEKTCRSSSGRSAQCTGEANKRSSSCSAMGQLAHRWPAAVQK